MDTTVLTQLVAALGPTGFVMWMVWRNTNHTIPRLAGDFNEAIHRQRKDFKETLSLQREEFEKAMTREREFHESQISRLVEAIRDLSKRPRCNNREDAA